MKLIDILRELGLLDWSVLAVGIQRGWVTKFDVAYYAIDLLSLNLTTINQDILVALANADSLDDSEVKTFLLLICGEINRPEVLEKWKLAKLINLSKSDLSEEEKLNKLQEIYAEFNYPEDMDPCSIYSQDSADPLIVMMNVISTLRQKFKQV